jgi:PhzF family phenazine biosynthesis protein
MDHDTRPTAQPSALRYAAFSDDPTGGNPAGVVLDAGGLEDERMQALAAEIGYSETAFLTGEPYAREPVRIRYFSPLAEVDFCGHATIATAVAIGERHGPGRLVLETNAGTVPVEVTQRDGATYAELTSVETSSVPATGEQVDATLAALGWERRDLGDLPAHVAFAGNHHLVLHVRDRARLAELDYDFETLKALMEAERWTTVDLVHPAGDVVHARNPFPVGGVVEDPATGAAAAAFGGYLLAIGEVRRPRTIVVHQGDDMGRPSRIRVRVDPGERRVRVAGTAVEIPR